MPTRTQRLRFLLASFLFATAAVSAQAQTLRIGLAEDPDVLDPTLARTFVGRIVFAALCDKLFDIDEKLEHRAAARDRLRVVGRQQGADDQAAPRRHLPRRREVRRRGGQVQHRAPQDDAGLQPPRRAGAGRRASTWSTRRPCGSTSSAPFSPLLAALADRAGMMVSPKAAQADRRQVRRASRSARARSSSSSAWRRTASCSSAIAELLEQGRDPLRQDHLPADRRRDRAPGQPASRASSTSSSAWRPPTCRRLKSDKPLQDLEDHRDRLPGHHHQHRQERQAQKNPLGKRPARARGLRAVARPRRHRAGGDGRRGRQPATSGSRRTIPTTRRTCRSRSATSRGPRRC